MHSYDLSDHDHYHFVGAETDNRFLVNDRGPILMSYEADVVNPPGAEWCAVHADRVEKIAV